MHILYEFRHLELKKKDKFEIRIYGTSEIHICVMLSLFCVCVCGIDIFFSFFVNINIKQSLKNTRI